MAKTQKIIKTSFRKQVEKKLKLSFAGLEMVLGNKKFKRTLKKMGETLNDELKGKQMQLALAALLAHKSGNGSARRKKSKATLTPQPVVAKKRSFEA